MENKIGKKKTYFQIIWRRLKKNKLAVAGMVVMIMMMILAVIAPYITPYPYDKQDYSAILAPSSSEHLLGTDELGRDTFSRLICGTTYSMEYGILSVVVGMVIGVAYGSISGYLGGRLDNILMRFLDIYQSIPMMILAIALAASIGPGMNSAVIAIGVATMPVYARLIRGSLLEIRGMEFIEASRAVSAQNWRILLKHMIPNAISPVIVAMTMSVGFNVLCGAALSFIGLGAQAPLPEWGAMLSAGRAYMRDYPGLVWYPGIMIMILVLSFNLFGDGLRDALDPRQN